MLEDGLLFILLSTNKRKQTTGKESARKRGEGHFYIDTGSDRLRVIYPDWKICGRFDGIWSFLELLVFG